MTVRIDVDIEGTAEVLANLGSLYQKLGDLEPVLSEFGEYMVRETWDERFEKEQTPEGKKWKDLKAETWARKRIPKILTESSNLRDRISYKADAKGVSIGTNVKYAAIHQFGGKAGRGRKSVIPARPFLGVNDRDISELNRIITEELAK